MTVRDVSAEVWASTLDGLMDAAAAVLTADSLDQTLRRVVERLGGLVPYNDLTLYEIDRAAGAFVPLFAYGSYAAEVMADSFSLTAGHHRGHPPRGSCTQYCAHRPRSRCRNGCRHP